MRHNVVVTGAAGYRAFTGWEVPGIRGTVDTDSRGPLTVVVAPSADWPTVGEPHVVPVSTVRELSAPEQDTLVRLQAYRREWAVKLHCSEREVYVPVALRPAGVPEEAW